MRGHIDATVLLGTGQAVHMIILVDGSAYGAEAVVAVGQYIGDGETLQSRRPVCLNDDYKGNIVGGQLVKLDLQFFHTVRCIVCLQDSISDGLLSGFLLGGRLAQPALQNAHRIPAVRDNLCSIQHIGSAFK